MQIHKNDKKLPELISIGVENFQTIGAYQEIPIGKLTFIYGPNSSGKSSLLDAAEILKQFWGRDEENNSDYGSRELNPFDDAAGGLSRILLKSIRREQYDTRTKDSVRLDAKVRVAPEYINKVAKSHYRNSALGGPVKLWNLSDYLSGREFLDIRGSVYFQRDSLVKLTLSVDEVSIISLDLEATIISINIDHPLLKSNSRFLGHGRSSVGWALDRVGEFGKFFTLIDGWLAYHCQCHCRSNRKIDTDDNFSFYLENAIDEHPEGEKISFYDTFAAFKHFASAYNEIIDFFSKLIAIGLDLNRVSGSRNTPKKEDVTFLIKFSGRVSSNYGYENSVKYGLYEHESKEAASDLGINVKGSPYFEQLARAATFKSIEQVVSKFDLNEDQKSWISHFSRYVNLDLLDRVNEAFRDHLLLDRSYQLVADTHYLIRPESALGESRLISEESGFNFGFFSPILIRLELLDPSGNRFAFEEVGSGIGYMLPVLVGIYTSSLSIVEQPELHLHPALQGALCDVFIEACHHGSRIVVESHSEHMMLRALRRVRNTSTGKQIAATLKLNPSDVCVLYFDPQPSGETVVKRLRVTSDGDFMDRWPGGFFGEREQDLFDE